MIKKIINNQEHFYYQIPKKYIYCDYKDVKFNISNLFLVVYCALDKWKTCQGLYRGTISKMAFDCGIFKPLTKKTNYMAQRIMAVLDYMLENDLFIILEGDYHTLKDEFVLQINAEKFEDQKSYVMLEDKMLDFIFNSNSLIKNSNLLQVLLCVLSPKIECKVVDKDTGEIVSVYYQVFSESVRKMTEKLGLSENTIRSALAALSDKYPANGKPLVIRKHRGYTKEDTHHSFPSIYTENSEGWEVRIKAELDFYDELVEKRLSE